MYSETDFSIISRLVDDFKHLDVEVYVFPQLWSDTSLGYSGCGGSAMTTAHTIIIGSGRNNQYRVYFGGDRLAYEVREPNDLFYKDMKNHCMLPVDQYEKYLI